MAAQGKGWLEFSNPRKEASRLTIHWNKEMTFDRAKGRAVFSGGVTVVSEKFEAEKPEKRTFEAQTLEIVIDEKEQKPKKIVALGDIYLYDNLQDMEATGQKFVWTAADDVGILTGEPTANLYYRGKRQASEEWRFEGFFAGDEQSRRVIGKGGVSFTFQEGGRKIKPPSR